MWLAAIAVVTLEVDAKLDPEARVLQGSVQATIANPTTQPLDSVYLWLYPNRFAEPPTQLDDVNRYWIYPRSFDAGGLELTGGAPALVMDHAKAGKRTLAKVRLATPVAPGAQTTVQIAFRTRIPHRYGPFGCAAGVCTLSGGWYPTPAFLDERGWDLEASPARTNVHVRVQSPWKTFLSGELRNVVDAVDAWQVSLVAYRRLHVETRTCAGVKLVYASRFTPVPPSESKVPYGLENFYQIGLNAACDAVRFLAELGIDPAKTSPSVLLAEVPLRHELAQPQGDTVLVSDRAWRILPLDRFRKFHTFQVARALYTAFFERRMEDFEAPRDLAWAPDAVASYLVDLFTVRQYRRREFARDVLKYVSFVPQIDNLMYAPKVAFTSAYFGGVEETDRWRDDLRRFNNDLPRGKRIYEKLRDLLGGRIVEVMRRVVTEQQPLRKAAEATTGQSLEWFFKQWLGKYPEGDLRIEAVESVRRGGRYQHQVFVRKRGKAIEPVTLWARDDKGQEKTLRWDGKGDQHVYSFESDAELDVVHLDPQERLVERWPETADDLRFDNRRPARWKLLYTNIGALFDLTEVQLAFRANFILRRVYDLRNSFSFGVFRTPATDFGGTVGYARGFGVQADANRLTAALGADVTVGRLNESFATAVGEPAHPGTLVRFAAGPGYDDRVWHLDPERGTAAAASGSITSTLLDGGAVLWTYGVGASLTRLFRVAAGHVLAGNVTAGAVFGDVRLATQLVSPGLPGYESDELFGRGAAALHFEYRHLFVQGLDWNVLHVGRGRGIGGAVLLDAAVLATCEDLGEGWFREDSAFFDAGYSLRGFFDHLGVSQAVLRIDMAFPLTRRQRSCLGYEVPVENRPPFSLTVVFAPSF